MQVCRQPAAGSSNPNHRHSATGCLLQLQSHHQGHSDSGPRHQRQTTKPHRCSAKACLPAAREAPYCAALLYSCPTLSPAGLPSAYLRAVLLQPLPWQCPAQNQVGLHSFCQLLRSASAVSICSERDEAEVQQVQQCTSSGWCDGCPQAWRMAPATLRNPVLHRQLTQDRAVSACCAVGGARQLAAAARGPPPLIAARPTGGMCARTAASTSSTPHCRGFHGSRGARRGRAYKTGQPTARPALPLRCGHAVHNEGCGRSDQEYCGLPQPWPFERGRCRPAQQGRRAAGGWRSTPLEDAQVFASFAGEICAFMITSAAATSSLAAASAGAPALSTASSRRCLPGQT